MAKIAFLENKYSRWYTKIINNAKNRTINGYIEKHHIMPRSLGGSNDKTNIVKLTAREHFICHLLLTKMVIGYQKELMQFAVGKFIQTAPTQQRAFTSWEYKKIRETISQVRTGRKHSEETRKKMSDARKGKTPWNKGIIGIVHSEESNRKRSTTLTGRKKSDGVRQKISMSKLGKPSGMLGKSHPRKGTTGLWKMSDEGKYNISQARKGIKFSQKHLANLKLANILNGLTRRGKQQRKETCTHCGKVGGAGAIKRYHNNNCKQKEH